MIFFLPEEIWKNKRGQVFGNPASYLKIGYHAGQDFHSNPIGEIPVLAPCDGSLTIFDFSKSAGWWGYFQFDYKGSTYSLKLLHMYDKMKGGKYKQGDVLGYCGATGLSITSTFGEYYAGPTHEEQTSNKAVPHLHAELHKGEYKHDTNKVKELADERIVDPVKIFEEWMVEGVNIESGREYIVEDKENKPVKVSKHHMRISKDIEFNTSMTTPHKITSSPFSEILTSIMRWFKGK